MAKRNEDDPMGILWEKKTNERIARIAREQGVKPEEFLADIAFDVLGEEKTRAMLGDLPLDTKGTLKMRMGTAMRRLRQQTGLPFNVDAEPERD